ncbi:MAG: gfo/Idh/MocA family oxidoreductase, partial [Victivallales bacterium]|nr:gfo/Idh/MocA family oxidoreductase [Victivallales bacterium]
GRTKRERYDHSNDYMEEFRHDYWRDRGEEAKKTGHGGGDYFVVSDFVEMVRHDREPFIDVYDSAAWSSLVELSKQSIDGKKTIEMPDFTRGKWKTRKA